MQRGRVRAPDAGERGRVQGAGGGGLLQRGLHEGPEGQQLLAEPRDEGGREDGQGGRGGRREEARAVRRLERAGLGGRARRDGPRGAQRQGRQARRRRARRTEPQVQDDRRVLVRVAFMKLCMYSVLLCSISQSSLSSGLRTSRSL